MATQPPNPDEVTQAVSTANNFWTWISTALAGLFGFGAAYGAMQTTVAAHGRKLEEHDRRWSELEGRFERIHERAVEISTQVNSRLDALRAATEHQHAVMMSVLVDIARDKKSKMPDE